MRVGNDLSATGTIDSASTSAIGSLSLLRGECRRAKERLSTDPVTVLAADLPGSRTEVRLNRNELDEAVREPLGDFVAVLHDTIDRSGLRPGDLVAVATIGGGARIPAATTTLSEHFQVPVITAPQPELTAAIGGGLTAVRGSAVEGATALAPAASPATQAAASPATQSAAMMAPEPPPASQALAWSDADDIPDVEPVGYDSDYFDYDEPGGRTTARPQLRFSEPEPAPHAALPWYRRPAVALGVGAVAALAVVGAAVFLVNRGDMKPTPTSPLGSVTSTTAPTQEPVVPAEQAPADEAPAQQQQTVTQQAPPAETVTQTEQPPAGAPPPAETPPPTTEAPPPTSEAPPPTSEAPATSQAPWSPTAPYPTIPGLPWAPAPGGGHRG